MSQHQPSDLPPYRAVLVVDIKDYSGYQGVEHQSLSEQVPEILAATFARIGRPEVWAEKSFHDSTGDGYAVGLDPRRLPLLIDPFLTGLQQELAGRHELATGAAARTPVRMRVSLSVGPLTDTGHNLLGDGKGAHRVEAHRLVDAPALKELLERTNPMLTFVAAILSERVFTDVVRAGYTRVQASEFTPAEVRIKQYQGTAYLYLPRSSGDALANGLVPGTAPVTSPTETPPTPAAPAAEGNRSRGGMGDLHEVSGTIIAGNDGAVQTGDGQQIIGDPGLAVHNSEFTGGIHQSAPRRKRGRRP
ncbi:hypothetical protein [Crossiella sp. CA198]|uniref:hypothetical protein n=1 Tax=Crossiella sp. CA198 TaxID=3455607 RepID=UPI003F8D667A